MSDPIAYFLTWTTYGSWLPGDERGWVKRGEWEIRPHDPERALSSRATMIDEAVVLSPEQRALVDTVIKDHCRIRGWRLHARNVRTNHVHVVVSAGEVDPKVVREQLKAWAGRRLSEQAGIPGREKNGRRRWWTEKGDIEWVRDDENLARVVQYVLEEQ